MAETAAAGFPLSAQQRRLWAARAHGPRNLRAVRLEGEVDAAALKAAIEAAVARHEILRTAFPPTPGLKLPLQVIDEHPRLGWEVLPPEDEAAGGDLEDIAARVVEAAGFDPQSGPPLSAWLVPDSEGHHGLVLAASALCADQASLDVLLADIGADLSAEGGAAAERPQPVQYADFAGWQEGLRDEQQATSARDFWRERVQAAEESSALPVERHDPEAGFRPARAVARLGADATARIEAAATQRGASAELFVAACWHVVLWRAAQPARQAVWHSFDGRVLDDLEDAVGPYAHLLPIAVEVEGELPFEALLDRLGAERSQAAGLQQFFGVGAEADGDQAPALQFEWTSPAQAADWVGARLSTRAGWPVGQPHTARLECQPVTDGIELTLSYDSGRLEQAQAACLLDAVLACVDAAADDPGTSVDRLPLLGADARTQRIAARDAELSGEPPAATWHEAIESQAAATPDAVAVEFGDESLTYAELVARARALAAHLAAAGVEAESPVGICLERSTGFVTAIVGVLMAGGCYVPLDPDYPSPYANRILADSGARALITQESFDERFAGGPTPILHLDEAAEAGGGEVPAPAVGPDSLAYVIYTSGSTGEPKGVMVTHGSVLALARALRETAYAGEEGRLRVSVNAPFTFDASVKQLVQLVFGHTLHVLQEDLRLDAHELSDHLEHRRVDVLDCTPSQLRPLLNAIEIHDARTYPRIVLVGGEPVGADLWSALREAGVLRAVNVYGPTEATVDATWAPVGDTVTPTIGRALPGVQALVLDPGLQPLPPGFVGELCLAGWGIARGYVGAPELTAAAFVEHPGVPGERLYRTGDLVRERPDGAIDYVGRRDRQVKVRGFRVDLGEIEAALERHPQVREAAVVDVATASGSKRVCAFVVADGAAAAGAEDFVDALKALAARELPDHMHPASYDVLDALPSTSHGKVDHAALRERGAAQAHSTTEYVAPRTPVEEQLAEIWRSVLDAERVGVNDDFFDSGGDSISQIIVVARAKERGLDLTPRDLFENPTIAALAEVCESAPAGAAS